MLDILACYVIELYVILTLTVAQEVLSMTILNELSSGNSKFWLMNKTSQM